MKTQALKKIIKEAVREVVQEELKEILLEAIKSPKQTIVESVPTSTPTQPLPGSNTAYQSKREAYQNILGDMQQAFNTQHVPKPFNPTGTMPGSDLPDGELDMSQIMGLMKK
jgi:hypothetical protein